VVGGVVGVGGTEAAVGGTVVGGTDVGAGGAPAVEVAVGGDAGGLLAPYAAYCAFTCWPQLVSAGPL